MNCKTIGIDTVDRLYPLVVAKVCNDLHINHPSDEAGGRVYDLIRREWASIIGHLKDKNCALVMVANQTERKLKTRTQEYDRIQPDLPKTGLDIVLDLADLIIHFGYGQDDSRLLFGTPKEHLIAGCEGYIQIDGMTPTFDAINDAIIEATQKSFEEILPVILLYGPPKIGKSTLLSQFPNLTVIDLVDGYKFQ